MHYYQFNVGDYLSHTGHLDPMEDLAYRRMLDYCYLHESGLPESLEEIGRLIRMRTHCDCIATVLREFFVQWSDGTWRNVRVDKELEAFADKSAKAAASARKRWEKPMRTHSEGNATVKRSESEGNATQEPITNNQEPIEKKRRAALDYACWPEQPSEQVLSDWLAMRKRLKADVSQTVINSFGRELHLAAQAGFTVDDCLMECVTSNWRGFKAAWIKGRTPTARHTDFENRNYNAGVTDGTF
jgi:uncharacterized protein YdaU (DUF1376 family)